MTQLYKIMVLRISKCFNIIRTRFKSMTSKEKSTIQELIATIYLRLNGYFTTSFIIHSEKNEIDGEVDIISVRFPGHDQEYTGHNSSKYLEIPTILIS